MTTHRFNVAEYYRMGELGLLSERTELIDGTPEVDPGDPRMAQRPSYSQVA